MNTVLTLKNIKKSFRDEGTRPTQALADIDLTVHENEFVTILSASGSGKSTLLRIIAGLIKPDSGEVLIYGKPPIPEEPQDAMVFQNFALLPYLTVSENIAFGLTMHDIPRRETSLIVRRLVEEMGLQGFEHNYPRELSGGMRQRVGIARALAVSPKVLLMDEPFSSLDEITSSKLRLEILAVTKRLNQTVIMVTHRIDEALLMADRLVILTSRPGTVAAIIENTLPRPIDKRSPAFFALEDRITSLIDQ